MTSLTVADLIREGRFHLAVIRMQDLVRVGDPTEPVDVEQVQREFQETSQKAAQDDAYMLGRTELRAQIHDRVLRMLDTAISAERKNALERVIQAVEELAP